ncbi:MAG: thioredoxin family protein [Myxococcota bacterium]
MFFLLSLPAFAAEAHLEWRGGVASIGIDARGEHVSPEAPTTVVVGDMRVELRGSPAAVRVPVAPGPVRVEVDVALCTDGSTACRSARFVGAGEVRGKRGRVVLVEEGGLAGASFGVATSGVVKVLDFGAVWCPPCNLMEAEVLHVAGATAGLPVDTIDVDQPASWALKDQYAVGGYPTLVAIDAAGVEVDRLVGYPGPTETRAWFASLGGVVPLDVLAKRVLDGGAAPGVSGRDASAAARRLAEGGRPAAARALFPVAEDGVDLRIARLLVDPSEADARWLFASDAPAGDWVYAALDAAPAAWADAVALAPTVPPVRGADLLYAAGTHAPPETARALTLSALALLRAALTGDVEKDRGHATFLASMMAETGDVDGALALLDTYAARFPDEFTFVYAAARHAFDAGRLPDAQARARTALGKSWGDQRLRAAGLLAKVLAARGQRPEAVFVIEAALREVPAPAADVEVRTHRYRKELETLREGMVTAKAVGSAP